MKLELNFKTPDSLGRWRFMGLITSKELKYAVIDETIDIEKDLIVKSEIPELFRLGNGIVISKLYYKIEW